MIVTEIIQSEVRGEEGSATVTLTAKELITLGCALEYAREDQELDEEVAELAEAFRVVEAAVRENLSDNGKRSLDAYRASEGEDDEQ